MTGWNMPPGCNVSDIPGNRPEDQEYEAQVEAICDVLDKHKITAETMTDDGLDALIESIQELLIKVRAQGYSEGQSDERQWGYLEKKEDLT